MIKNVIFDVGRVLLKYNPKKFMEHLGYSSSDIEDMAKLIFSSDTWQELDRGTLTNDEAIEYFIGEKPHLKHEIEYVMKNWKDHLTPIEDNASIIGQLKDKGHKLYIISNFHKEAFEYLRDKYEFFGYFDDIIISADVKLLKPDKKIYLHLINKYNLIPEECVFIDDMEMNIDAAKSLGMNTIWYKDNVSVKDELKKLECLVNL